MRRSGTTRERWSATVKEVPSGKVKQLDSLDCIYHLITSTMFCTILDGRFKLNQVNCNFLVRKFLLPVSCSGRAGSHNLPR